jgi:hypothetical protein
MLLLGMRSVTRSIPEELYSGGGIVVIMRSPCVYLEVKILVGRADARIPDEHRCSFAENIPRPMNEDQVKTSTSAR